MNKDNGHARRQTAPSYSSNVIQVYGDTENVRIEAYYKIDGAADKLTINRIAFLWYDGLKEHALARQKEVVEKTGIIETLNKISNGRTVRPDNLEFEYLLRSQPKPVEIESDGHNGSGNGNHNHAAKINSSLSAWLYDQLRAKEIGSASNDGNRSERHSSSPSMIIGRNMVVQDSILIFNDEKGIFEESGSFFIDDSNNGLQDRNVTVKYTVAAADQIMLIENITMKGPNVSYTEGQRLSNSGMAYELNDFATRRNLKIDLAGPLASLFAKAIPDNMLLNAKVPTRQDNLRT